MTGALATAVAASASGLVAAGLLVGTWEFAEIVLARVWPRLREAFAALAAPAVLGFVEAAVGVRVPWGTWAIAAIVPWLWLPLAASALASVAAAAGWAVVAAVALGGGAQVPVGAGLLLALGGLGYLLCRRGLCTRSRYVAAYAFFALAILVLSAFSPRGTSDALYTAVTAALVGVYAAGRAVRARLWAETERQAREDALTGALTRYGLAAWLAALDPGAKERGLVLALDLDDFKWFNDTWGHALGDAVLAETARRVRAALREQDALVRPGGDEFTVWMPHVLPELGDAVAARVHAAVTEPPFEADGVRERLRMSVGWAAGALSPATAASADRALLEAKHGGKNRVVGAAAEGAAAAATLVDAGRRPAWWLGPAVDALWLQWREAAVVTDAAGRVVALNPAYERLTGREASALVGRQPGVQSAGVTPPTVYARLWRRLGDGDAVRAILRNRRPDGMAWWAVEDLSPIDHGGIRVGYWAVVRDALTRPTPPATEIVGLEALTVTPVFQPVVALASGQAIGYEALARPTLAGEAVAPTELFRVAEAAGALLEADRMCLEAVAAALSANGPWPAATRLALNVRVVTLIDGAAWLAAYLARLPVARDALVLEVSEADRDVVGVDDWRGVRRTFRDVAFAIDDWGSGWHDIHRLVALEPVWTKVDRDWLLAAESSGAARDLLAHLARWARANGTGLIVEGVETQAQAERVRSLGIGFAQGFLWGEPRSWPRSLGRAGG
jgi:diguanylate cyclase (GGDEF)-like protein/PAS domain S-box-containing protein